MVKGQTAKKNFLNKVKSRDTLREDVLALLKEAKEIGEGEPGYLDKVKEANSKYLKMRKIEASWEKKGTGNKYFQKEYPDGELKDLKFYRHPSKFQNSLFSKKKGIDDDIAKAIESGHSPPAKQLRGKTPVAVPVGETTDKETQTEDPTMPTATAKPVKDDDKTSFGTQQGKVSQMEEEEVSPGGMQPPPPVPGAAEAEEAKARDRMQDWLVGVAEGEASSWIETYEAGLASESQKDHREKEVAAHNKMIQHLGSGWRSVDPEDRKMMFKWYYSQTHVNDAPEASQPTEPDVNNGDAEATPQNEEEAMNMDDIRSMYIEEDTPPVVPAPDVSNDPAAQSTTYSDRTTQGDAPEFQQFNAPVPNINIEIDDTSPAGSGLPPAGSGIPVSDGTAGMPGASMLTSSSLLNSVNFPTDAAQKLIEDRMRAKKSINALKEEIRAMHLIYDDDIPAFKQQPHVGQKNDALKSGDIKVVRAHHKSMQDTIRNYYKTSDLKVGVILSAEGFFGGAAGASPNLAALTQPRLGEIGGSNVRVSRPGHEFDNAVAGETRVNRLGRNYRKPVSRNVPKVGNPPTASQVKEPQQIDDVERPLRRQRGFRQRRINSEIPGMKIILKTGKK